MVRNLVSTKPLTSSFLSCEKDAEIIWRRLLVESKPYSEQLKRLLVINTKDCLDNTTSKVYEKILKAMSLSKMVEEGYIRQRPKIRFPEHEEIKSYIILSFDNFSLNAKNPHFRDCDVNFDIICHTDYWDLGDYRCRPLKIAGYIDGLLNAQKLTGIGELYWTGCNEIVLDENLAGYGLTYRAIHGSDDQIPAETD